MDKKDFKHRIQIRVRSYEVDWQGIVHNSNYLRYFEVGRIEYLKHIGATVNMESINRDHKVVLVRHEIDYEYPARFDELLNVYTRVSFIKDSSFGMEGILKSAEGERILSRTVAYHVWLDAATNRPKTIGAEFRELVKQFEGDACNILWPSLDV